LISFELVIPGQYWFEPIFHANFMIIFMWII
jgi:hypothetical protein